MSDWSSELIERTKVAVKSDSFWKEYFGCALKEGTKSKVLHLAIFIEPYLKYILDGKKTVESRFSSRLQPPFNLINKGDIVLLKRSGGYVHGICRVSNVWFYELEPKTWKDIKNNFANAICPATADFWDKRVHALYATLIRIRDVYEFDPICCNKQDRRGWVIMNKCVENKLLF
jgi:hypothetical protein